MPLEIVVRDEGVQEPLGVPEILRLLPHRHPMLFVDRIDRLEPGRYAEGVKCVTANEPFLGGHFPDYPIMPGVFIVEALAQLGGIMLRSSGAPAVPSPAPDAAAKAGGHGVLASIQRMRFLRPVLPGDQLQLRVTLIKSLGNIHQVKVEGLVHGQAAAAGELVLAS
jgi:3-hydroxyacyl-[acyl-carrier-protein] dehydratase